MIRYCRHVIALVVAVAVLPGALRAEVRPELGDLFTAGAKNTTPSVELARQRAVSLKRANRRDLRIDYAYGLVLANQRRYTDAERLLGRYLASQPDDLAAHRIKLWNEIQGRQYPVALNSIAKLANLLSKHADGGPSAEQLDTAKYLGTCIGFLELVHPKGVDEKIVADRKNSLLTRLGEEYLSAFDEGRLVVASALEQLEADREARLKRAEDAEAKKAEQIAADLSDNNDKIAAKRETIQSSAEVARESQRELGVIQQQLRSLAPDRTRLSAQIIMLQAQLAQLQNPTTNTITNPAFVGNRNGEAPRPGDVFVGRNTQSNSYIPLDRLVQAQAIALALAAINKQAFDMDRQILSLQTRGAELSGVSQAEFKKLSESQAATEKAAKRAEILSEQLERQEAETHSRPTGPTGRMTRFSTYAPLPYQQETQRVLSWFEK